MNTAADIPLLIRSENSASERRISPSWTITHLKDRLEPITGIPATCQRLSLKVGSQAPLPITAQSEDATQLASWPLQAYAEIQVRKFLANALLLSISLGLETPRAGEASSNSSMHLPSLAFHHPLQTNHPNPHPDHASASPYPQHQTRYNPVDPHPLSTRSPTPAPPAPDQTTPTSPPSRNTKCPPPTTSPAPTAY